jgi:SAM-dependent methyltransferase
LGRFLRHVIIHKLIIQHLRRRDDSEFYAMQAEDAIKWIRRQGVELGKGTTVLDLGCGHGIFGAALQREGCLVAFADETNLLLPELRSADFITINLDTDDLSKLGQYDLVICSNVLEHLAKPERFLGSVDGILKREGRLYLSWTNWLSPWGGHEFSPFHFFGPRFGPRLYDKLLGLRRPRIHTPFVNLFPTSIGRTLRFIRNCSGLRVAAGAPRYYPELAFILRIPLLREFLTWNCALLLRRS